MSTIHKLDKDELAEVIASALNVVASTKKSDLQLKAAYMKKWRNSDKRKSKAHLISDDIKHVNHNIDIRMKRATPNAPIVTDVTRFLKQFGLIEEASLDFHETENFTRRLEHLKEELDELLVATDELDKIDALLDLVYIAIGTLVLMKVNIPTHWNEIQRANLTKERGVSKRGHEFDVFKPENWIEPQHEYIRNQTRENNNDE
jgi:predicted HAD superfamily Cof-like phosphohydrolase